MVGVKQPFKNMDKVMLCGGPYSGDFVECVGVEAHIGVRLQPDGRFVTSVYRWNNPYGGDLLVALYQGDK